MRSKRALSRSRLRITTNRNPFEWTIITIYGNRRKSSLSGYICLFFLMRSAIASKRSAAAAAPPQIIRRKLLHSAPTESDESLSAPPSLPPPLIPVVEQEEDDIDEDRVKKPIDSEQLTLVAAAAVALSPTVTVQPAVPEAGSSSGYDLGDDDYGELTAEELAELDRVEREANKINYNNIIGCMSAVALYKDDAELDRLWAMLDNDQRNAVEFATSDRRPSCWVTGRAGTGKSQIISCVANRLARIHAKRRMRAQEGVVTSIDAETKEEIMAENEKAAAAILSEPFVIAVTSSTGVSSVQIGGCTIHSYIGTTESDPSKIRDRAKHIIDKNPVVRDRILNTRTIILEEISMISGNFLTCIDRLLRTIRKIDAPFGGIQLIAFGDLLQLPPVRAEQEGMCYQSPSWDQAIGKNILYLNTVYRQTCPLLSRVLQNMRALRVDGEDQRLIQSRLNKQGDPAAPYIYPTNYMAERKNLECLSALNSKHVVLYCAGFWARDDESFRNFVASLLVDKQIQLRVGCRMMLTKNYATDELANGSAGEVVDFLRVPVRIWNAIITRRTLYNTDDPMQEQKAQKYNKANVPTDAQNLQNAYQNELYDLLKEQLAEKWKAPGFTEVGILGWTQPHQFLDMDVVPMGAPNTAEAGGAKVVLPFEYNILDKNRGVASARRSYKLLPRMKQPGKREEFNGPTLELNSDSMWFPLIAFDAPNSIGGGNAARPKKLRVVMPCIYEHSVQRFIGKDRPPIHEVVAWLYQLPLMYGWAFTVHKSQGMTFDRANVDIGGRTFADNQAYVALSRVRTLQGLSVTSFNAKSLLLMNGKMVEYYNKLELMIETRRQQQQQQQAPTAASAKPSASAAPRLNPTPTPAGGRQTTMDSFVRH